MRKFLIFISIIIITTLLAATFGIIHDAITASISPEYFTKFKFIQFHIAAAMPFAWAVAIVGIIATWWTGLIIGIILGAIGCFSPNYIMMWKYVWRGIGMVFCITICSSILGFLFGKIYFAKHIPSWYYYPDGLIDKTNFVIVGTIHNASYLGGLLGLMVAVSYLIRQRIC